MELVCYKTSKLVYCLHNPPSNCTLKLRHRMFRKHTMSFGNEFRLFNHIAVVLKHIIYNSFGFVWF